MNSAKKVSTLLLSSACTKDGALEGKGEGVSEMAATTQGIGKRLSSIAVWE